MNRPWLLRALLGLALVAPGARAADHADGPAVTSDPAADIDDVFAWMSPDARTLYLAMTIGRNVAADFRFSDQVHYVFHTTSSPSFGSATRTDVDVICEFNSSQRVQCWAGDSEFVSGVASSTAGIVNASGHLRVFAGQRNDPFFFNLAGFQEVARTVAMAAPALTFDPADCPQLDAATSGALVGQLAMAPGGGAAPNSFHNFNALALVVAVDKSVVTPGGPIVGVWGGTYRR